MSALTYPLICYPDQRTKTGSALTMVLFEVYTGFW